MPTKTEDLTLENIKDGAALERFNLGIADVMKNIQDPNMEATAIREINLKMVFKATKDRDLASIVFQVTPKLAPLAPIVAKAAIGINEKGIGVAREITPMQQTQLPLASVHSFNDKEKIAND